MYTITKYLLSLLVCNAYLLASDYQLSPRSRLIESVKSYISAPDAAKYDKTWELYDSLSEDQKNMHVADMSKVCETARKIMEFNVAVNQHAHDPASSAFLQELCLKKNSFNAKDHSAGFYNSLDNKVKTARSAFASANDATSTFTNLVMMYTNNPNEQTYHEVTELYHQRFSSEQREAYEQQFSRINKIHSLTTAFNQAEKYYDNNPTSANYFELEAAYGNIRSLKLPKAADQIFRNRCTDKSRQEVTPQEECYLIAKATVNDDKEKEHNITRLFELYYNGCKVHEKNKDGKSLLDLAKEHGNSYITDIFQDGY